MLRRWPTRGSVGPSSWVRAAASARRRRWRWRPPATTSAACTSIGARAWPTSTRSRRSIAAHGRRGALLQHQRRRRRATGRAFMAAARRVRRPRTDRAAVRAGPDALARLRHAQALPRRRTPDDAISRKTGDDARRDGQQPRLLGAGHVARRLARRRLEGLRHDQRGSTRVITNYGAVSAAKAALESNVPPAGHGVRQAAHGRHRQRHPCRRHGDARPDADPGARDLHSSTPRRPTRMVG